MARVLADRPGRSMVSMTLSRTTAQLVLAPRGVVQVDVSTGRVLPGPAGRALFDGVCTLRRALLATMPGRLAMAVASLWMVGFCISASPGARVRSPR